ncbi:MAG: type II secretion system protein GspC [Kangiellaceae bacterium]|nr:type II secretion system protein GspC [Kangiellaceae bacterium]
MNNILGWSKNYVNWLPTIQWGGWLLITFLAAKLFWTLFIHFTSADISNQKASISQLTSQAKSGQTVNVNKLVQRHLFGSLDSPVEQPKEVVNVPITRLNLTLRGTYAANNNEKSNSIIEDGKGKQAVYFVDDKLKVSGTVYLRQVYRDKVILETNGVKEELRLKDSVPVPVKSNQKTLTSKKSTNKRVDDKRKNKQITKSLNKYRKQLSDDPLSLIGLVNYQPKTVNGEMIGIQISPGKDKRLFTQLGLRRRDIITSINGTSLSNPQDAMQLLSDLQNTQEFQVEISRGNETISLLLNLEASSNEKTGI